MGEECSITMRHCSWRNRSAGVARMWTWKWADTLQNLNLEEILKAHQDRLPKGPGCDPLRLGILKADFALRIPENFGNFRRSLDANPCRDDHLPSLLPQHSFDNLPMLIRRAPPHSILIFRALGFPDQINSLRGLRLHKISQRVTLNARGQFLPAFKQAPPPRRQPAPIPLRPAFRSVADHRAAPPRCIRWGVRERRPRPRGTAADPAPHLLPP